MTQHEASSAPARNLVRAFGLLDILADTPEGHTLAELADAAGIPEATAHRLLSVLADLHVVRTGEGGRWRVGRRCLELGAAYLDSVEVRSEARDLMRAMTERTGETCALGVLDEDRVVYVEKIDSPHAVRMHSAIGRSNPAATSSLGRAILAWSADEVVDQVLAEGISTRTSRTMTDIETLRAELARSRRRGYSVDNGENESGIRAVGAPVLDYRGEPVAALSLAGPEQRIGRRRLTDLGAEIAKVAAELSERLGYSARVSGTLSGNPPTR